MLKKSPELLIILISNIVADASQMGECGEACHTRDDCVAAIYDSESVKCYIWPSTIERRKLAGSGVWLITAMCPEEQAQVWLVDGLYISCNSSSSCVLASTAIGKSQMLVNKLSPLK